MDFPYKKTPAIGGAPMTSWKPPVCQVRVIPSASVVLLVRVDQLRPEDRSAALGGRGGITDLDTNAFTKKKNMVLCHKRKRRIIILYDG